MRKHFSSCNFDKVPKYKPTLFHRHRLEPVEFRQISFTFKTYFLQAVEKNCIKIKIQHHFQTYGCNATPKKYCGGKNDDVTIEISHRTRLLSTSGSNSFRLKICNPTDVNCKYKIFQHFLDFPFNVNIF